MWSTLLGLVGNIFKPACDLIDELHTSDEEKLEAKAKMMVIQNELTSKMLDVQKTETEAARDVIVAEAKGEGILQRNWRPIIMLLFGAIIANNYILNPWLSAMFSIDVVMEVPNQMWSLLNLGIGGYIVGRSVEKGISTWKGSK